MLGPDRRWRKGSGVRFPPSLRRSRPSRESQPHLGSARVEPARAGHPSIGDIRIGAGSGENGAAGCGSVWSDLVFFQPNGRCARAGFPAGGRLLSSFSTAWCRAYSVRRRQRFAMGSGMSRFYFDVLIDCRVLSDLGGMSFRYAESAKSVADKLAGHLALRRSDLCSRGNCVRVRDQRGEIHRSPIAGPAVYTH